MLFSSISFITCFLPAVILLYFLVPKKWKNRVLLLASLFFYFYGEQVYLLVILGSTLSGYLHGILMDRAKRATTRKLFLVSSIVVSGSALFLFKYADFFVETLNAFGLDLPLLKLGLPLGISFYTFQILSYTIDVYRRTTPAQNNLADFATYVTLFPQLIAGPIVRYATIEQQLTSRTHSFDDFAAGARRLIIGLAKKILVANVLANLGEVFRGSDAKSVLFYWLYYTALILQLYFDFSAYSDMAIGMGRMFGFHFLENFNYPLISRSITEFWRRWHISLGTWLRDYLYIPMGGNRCSKSRWIFNIAVVWLFTGLWHGAGWNFVLWGVYFAVVLVAEKWFLNKILGKLPSALKHVYFYLLILISFVLFDGSSATSVLHDLKAMAGWTALPFASPETWYYLRSYAVILLLAVLGATPIPRMLWQRSLTSPKLARIVHTLEPLYLILLLLSATAFLVDGSFNPFLYFRF